MTIWLFIELLPILGLSAQAQQQFNSMSIVLLQPVISQMDFIPPRNGKPKDTSGAGSRSGLNMF
ncbi:MAG: hypothetical protein HC862_08425 [Scytonema sp. RU_4_4]|nr:hypothetical protein [Scytonema sp. RU_4_4]